MSSKPDKPGNNLLALGYQLLLRDIRERYTGTLLGWCWLLVNPLFMLLIYSFIFGEVLQLRFGVEIAANSHFAFYLFAGLLVFNALSEVMIRTSSVLQERREMLLNTPLSPWLLPVLPVLVSVLLEWIALSILLLALGIWGEFRLIALVFYLPYFLVRFILSLALAFIIAPAAVFFRDLRQIMPAVLTVLLFVSPILYPPEVIPERFLALYDWNLLSHLVTGYREALLEGVLDVSRLSTLLWVAALSLLFSVLAFNSLMPRARYVL